MFMSIEQLDDGRDDTQPWGNKKEKTEMLLELTVRGSSLLPSNIATVLIRFQSF